jgi:hypothetical protein
MASKPGHRAVDNIDEALKLLDRVSRFLSVGDFRAGDSPDESDPLVELERAAQYLARARDALHRETPPPQAVRD